MGSAIEALNVGSPHRRNHSRRHTFADTKALPLKRPLPELRVSVFCDAEDAVAHDPTYLPCTSFGFVTESTLTESNDLFYVKKQMERGELLGSLEYIVLLALVRLDGTAHGMLVRREIEARTGRDVSIGAVYATLERLEAKGYISSYTGEPTPERGGRAKRLFHVEAGGKRAIRISEETIRSMSVGLKDRRGTT